MARRLDLFTKTIQDNGYRMTTSRKAIIDSLLASDGHVSADELVALVRAQKPGIGRMTVYRTLELLSDLGLIRPVYQGTAAAHYILMDEGHHHHLVCSRCDRVIEFNQCVLREIEQSVSQHHEFVIQGHLLEIFGLCPDCCA
jgi:Fur family ferric uptake transcriptional regulator